MCVDRLATGKEQACTEICPTGALISGRRGDLLAQAEGRIGAEPDRYVNHIYGKDDAGGTSVLYLSAFPFEKLGLENLGSEPVPKLSEDSADFLVPAILVGGPLLLGAIHTISKRGAWEEEWPL
jgi:formate dehydrogenase iron-sulfur subunit